MSTEDTTMTEPPVFGSPEPNVQYSERRAAYVVIISDERVAMVNSGQKHFLPGGGSLPGEAAAETVLREVREELARHVRLVGRLGEATQYFYSSADDRHYKMLAVFFAGELTDEACAGTSEHQLDWLPVADTERACFHACHAWAVRRASAGFSQTTGEAGIVKLCR
ncbi:MAG TPA: NUDIX domain-containing protein [Pyrinomonadaceae bacterium]|nr:NUDIX domain-containing protein [Pyrinomonadaceae bacterium]